MFELLVASGNEGKVEELRELLCEQAVVLRSLNEFKGISPVEETGATFTQNATLKARSYALQTGLWAIADDSGLEVAALKNKPGIYSARYAGEGATDIENTDKLLKNLSGAKSADRSAQFVCVIAVSNENGEIQFTSQGLCKGEITLTPSGTRGFGYDPVFMPVGYRRTFGELPDNIKREISHRAIAVKKIIEYLSQIEAC